MVLINFILKLFNYSVIFSNIIINSIDKWEHKEHIKNIFIYVLYKP